MTESKIIIKKANKISLQSYIQFEDKKGLRQSFEPVRNEIPRPNSKSIYNSKDSKNNNSSENQDCTEEELIKNIESLQKMKIREIQIIEEKYDKSIQNFQVALDQLRF